jgi:hypothetical protein
VNLDENNSKILVVPGAMDPARDFVDVRLRFSCGSSWSGSIGTSSTILRRRLGATVSVPGDGGPASGPFADGDLVYPHMAHRLRLVTVSKDSPLSWIRMFVAYYVNRYGIDEVIFYQNTDGRGRYDGEVARALEEMSERLNVDIVMAWAPFKFGQPPDRRLYDYFYCHSSLTFDGIKALGPAEWAINADIDEFINVPDLRGFLFGLDATVGLVRTRAEPIPTVIDGSTAESSLEDRINLCHHRFKKPPYDIVKYIVRPRAATGGNLGCHGVRVADGYKTADSASDDNGNSFFHLWPLNTGSWTQCKRWKEPVRFDPDLHYRDLSVVETIARYAAMPELLSSTAQGDASR